MTPIAPGAKRTMSSREIAELTEKNHADVLRDIRNMLEQLGFTASSFAGSYKDSTGRTLPTFDLPEDLTITLVSGYSVQMRHRIVKRWQELEAKAPAAIPDFGDPVAMARAWADAKEAERIEQAARLEAERTRDEAIRTKSLIGSKREATAMATASAAKREAAALRDELGACARHATITAVQIATGTEYKFAPMRRWCANNGAAPVDVPDKRYGTVKAWPAAAWAICHGVDLAELFGGGA